MLFVASIPVGLTFGAVTWALIRGRGGLGGLLLSMMMGIIGATVGGLAAMAIAGGSPGALAVGVIAGATLSGAVEAIGWGPRPRRWT